jgi:hypothetical protein
MDGVNAELRPWVRVTHPHELRDLAFLPAAKVGAVAFKSWLG